MMKLLPQTFAGAMLLSMACAVSALDSGIASKGLPSATAYSESALPQLDGVLPWKTLGEVKPVWKEAATGRYMVPKFTPEVEKLDGKPVRVYGFAVPLATGPGLRHFLLSAVPPECPFCMPAGPEAIVEVHVKKPVAFRAEPVLVSGRFEIVRDDDSVIWFRLNDAEQIDVSGIR